MINSGHFAKPTFLEKIDIFGIAIAIRFNSLPTHNTRFGGLITVSILVALRVLFAQETPTVIFSDDYVKQPEIFELKPDTFNFAIGMQDVGYQQFMDPRIYTVQATVQSMRRVYNDATGQYDPIWSNKNIELVTCTKDNFKIQQSQDYFLKIPYSKMYCFKPDETDAAIEGEFSAPVYRAISLDFIECLGEGCASDEEKQQYLRMPTLGLFVSNNLIQITNKKDPKLAIGKNLYWKSGPQLAKYITLNLVNNYINSDFALLGKKVEKQRVVTYSSSAEQVLPRTSAVMYTLLIVYEKNREINYYRRYIKLDEVELINYCLINLLIFFFLLILYFQISITPFISSFILNQQNQLNPFISEYQISFSNYKLIVIQTKIKEDSFF